VSLLTDTQGTPERVWALLKLLGAYGDEMPREGAFRSLQAIDPSDTERSVFKQTLGAADSLGLIERDRTTVKLRVPLPQDIPSYSDLVHRLLLSSQGEDRALFQVYAWFVVNCDIHGGTKWIGELSNRKDLADRIKEGLPPGEDGVPLTFNDTRIPYWRNWMCLLGLGVHSDLLGTFYPSPTRRLKRTLSEVGKEFGYGSPLDISQVLTEISNRMPYLDSGEIFQSIQITLKTPRKAQVSRILSASLRDLHDDECITLQTFGDASGTRQLANDPQHKIQNVKSITINEVINH